MSGDFGPRVAIPAGLAFAQSTPDSELHLYGDVQLLNRFLPSQLPANVVVHDASECIAMDAKPKQALKQGQQTSMWKALESVAHGETDACISAGNTGALMLIARKVLGCVNGVEVPAFCKSMPVEQGETYMLDLGANLHASAEQLVQFAMMGGALASREFVAGERPSVALLNIGTELEKGTENIRAAGERLSQLQNIEYVGFIEADDIFTGKVNVIVSDGFNGNIALKASEGVARLIKRRIEYSFAGGARRLLAVLIAPILSSWRKELNPDSYNGATLLGVAGTVVKSHGGASKEATLQALNFAYDQAMCKVPDKVKSYLAAE